MNHIEELKELIIENNSTPITGNDPYSEFLREINTNGFETECYKFYSESETEECEEGLLIGESTLVAMKFYLTEDRTVKAIDEYEDEYNDEFPFEELADWIIETSAE